MSMKRAKVGLIAVSGVRIYNDRLRRFGVTLPGFFERARTIASMPSLGLLTLAAVTPDDFEVTYLECPDFDPAFLATTDFFLEDSRCVKWVFHYRGASKNWRRAMTLYEIRHPP